MEVDLDLEFQNFDGSFGDNPDSGPDLDMSSIPDFMKYKMNHKRRGRFIIINNVNFYKETGMDSRHGSDVDAENLKECFSALSFTVDFYRNLKVDEIINVFQKAANDKQFNNESDCFGCAILSHGDLGIVYGIDNIVYLESLMNLFQGNVCPELSGKPKIFIIQACRGTKMDDGVEVSDAEVDYDKDEILIKPKEKFLIPSGADFLYAYSTVPGYFSWRNNDKGSWFIQALTNILTNYAHSRDLIWMLTRVNRMVAYDFKSNTTNPSMRNKKQVPSIVSMLTKDVFFTTKTK